MCRARLAEAASAVPTKIACGFVPNRRPCVCVAGGAELVGRHVTVKEGGLTLAEGVIPRKDGRVWLELALPYPPFARPYGPLHPFPTLLRITGTPVSYCPDGSRTRNWTRNAEVTYACSLRIGLCSVTVPSSAK